MRNIYLYAGLFYEWQGVDKQKGKKVIKYLRVSWSIKPYLNNNVRKIKYQICINK